MQRLAPIGLALVLAACGSSPLDTPTPVPRPSVADDVQARGQVAMEAFLAAMADPEVTYRLNGRLRVGEEDADGHVDILINTRYDVKGDEYAGGLDIHLRDPTVGGFFNLAVLDGTAHLAGRVDDIWSMEAPDSLRRPNRLRRLTVDDLTLLRVTDEGLYEFAVAPWLAGDPLGEWVDLGTVPERSLPHTELRWHDSRLTLDESGVPQRLVHSWQVETVESDEMTSGTIVEEFEGLGMYVTFADVLGPLGVSSYDVEDGPWREIVPAGDTATVDVSFVNPVMLGIEGAIYFVRSHDSDGVVIRDAIFGFEEAEIEVPAGRQTLVAYYRTCSGACGRLDGARDFCAVDADLEEGARYRLTVDIDGAQRDEPAACSLVPIDG